MTPLSLRAINCIESRLRRISEDGGYHTSAGLCVRFSPPSEDSDSPSGCALWCAGESVSVKPNSSAKATVLQVSIVGWVRVSQANTGKLLECLKADIKVAVERGWDGYLVDDIGAIGTITYTGATAQPRESGDLVESVQLTFDVGYIEGVGNPYSPQDARRAV